MKILLVSINASYMHTSLAIRSLKVYAEKYFESSEQRRPEILLAEYTINQSAGEVLRGIGFTGADVVLFSTYIWNAEYVCKILPDVKKILPGSLCGAGGPEFSYSADKYLKLLPDLDFIMAGEGEKTFCDFVSQISSSNKWQKENCAGLFYRDEQGKTAFSGERSLIENLDEIPFAYPDIIDKTADPDHKIYYYESSRGCPFGCAYCLSSLDKRVRFKSLEKVFEELKYFLDAGTALVKFVDRTYNLQSERYIAIWKYILQNHNKKTMFHFEIEAEYLSEEALEFLRTVPEGVMQFEMGVQSANKKTLQSINRSQNIEKLAQNISLIPRTIHQHLDLIAGLPFENLESFGKSFDYVMALKPDALQLGFLKVLSGTQMEDYAVKNGWKWMENPVYECFSTPYLSFEDMAFLKEIEILTDAFWNKGLFSNVMNYILRTVSPWDFFCALNEYGRKYNAFVQARRDSWWFELLAGFLKSELPAQSTGKLSAINKHLAVELLRYDFVLSGKKGNFPDWYVHLYDKEKHRILLEENDMLGNSRIGFAFTEYEEFDFDVTAVRPEDFPGKKQLLIRYKK